MFLHLTVHRHRQIFAYCYNAIMSQKYVIAHFIESVEPKFNFSCKKWPLHITLLPNFVITVSLDELIAKLSKISESTKPFDIKVGGDARFGPSGEVLVSLIEPEPAILSLHHKLQAITEHYKFDTPHYIGDGYRPHATKQANKKLISGKSYPLSSITLVDMFPGNDIQRREIIKNFYFD